MGNFIQKIIYASPLISQGRYRAINTNSYSIERLDHLGIIAGVIKDLNIVELIDKRLGSFQGETLSAGGNCGRHDYEWVGFF
ncbi:MAG: DUF4277 domain-containing protein [Ghiorsea sp.]|nr:DUF4277 domain-containing protein [Ghiorsea sp.]